METEQKITKNIDDDLAQLVSLLDTDVLKTKLRFKIITDYIKTLLLHLFRTL